MSVSLSYFRVYTCIFAATVLFFGSARAKDREDYDLTLAELTEQLASTTNPKDRAVPMAHTCLESLLLVC